MVAITTGALLGASAISSLGGLAGNIISTKLSLSKAKELAAYQAALNYDYAEKQARNQYNWNRAGLESAGYNPMLAVQNGVSGANSSWTSGGDGSVPDIGSTFQNGLANATDYVRLGNETLTAESSANLNNAQAETEKSRKINMDFDTMMKDVQKHLLDKDLEWYDRKVNADIYKSMQEAEQARAVSSVQSYNAETARIGAEAQKTIAQNESISNPYKYVHDTLRRHLKSFEKDHPYLSGSKQFKSLTNFVNY